MQDKYDWEKEIVVITGGAGGIGGQVVKLMAERGTKVVVLDVIPMTFEAPKNVFYCKCDITSPATLANDQVSATLRYRFATYLPAISAAYAAPSVRT